jgi:hypothetical protein
MAPTYHFVTSLIYTSTNLFQKGTATVWIQTHAKEKLPTFCIAATGAPLMVIFVKGVFARVWAPNQSIARTEAWPPNQLQLKCKKAREAIQSFAKTHLISASPALRWGLNYPYLLNQARYSPRSASSTQSSPKLQVEEVTSLHPIQEGPHFPQHF